METGQFEFSRHAFRRVVERNISEHEIREAGLDAEVIVTILTTSIRRAGYCWGSRPSVDRCIFKFLMRTRI